MNDDASNPKDSFRLVGINNSSHLIWYGNVVDFAVAAVNKLGFMFRARKYFSAALWQHYTKLKYDGG